MSVATETLNSGSTTGDPVARLLQSDVAGGILLRDLLAIQCQVVPAAAAAILENRPDGSVRTVATYPESIELDESEMWLMKAHELARRAEAGRRRRLVPLRDSASPATNFDQPHILMIPVPRSVAENSAPEWMAACLVRSADDAHNQQTRLQLTVGLLGIARLRRALDNKSISLERLRTVLETAAAVGSETRFRTAAMRLCNELAVRWRCERVSLGFVKKNGVELQATSFAADFARHIQVVLDLQAAMEECYDQDVEISHPDDEQSVTVTRAAERLAQRHGSNTVLSLPLRRGDEVVGVVTAELSGKDKLQVEDIEAVRLACELCTPRIGDLHERDRWVGARWADAARASLAALVGPKHTWAKVAAISFVFAIVFLTTFKIEYRVEAPFVLKATRLQQVVAPFDGHLKSAPVMVGDNILGKATVLATLDTSELDLELAAAKAEATAFRKQASVALREGQTAEAMIAEAQSDKVAARINLLAYQKQKAEITSDIDGAVVSGDLDQRIGAPVKTGEVLLEVAQLESIWVDIALPDDQVADVAAEMRGELATTSYPNQKIALIVERVEPMADVVNQRNVFKVRARLLETPDWMRPGMRGVAKIDAGKRACAWIWTRQLVNWLRMKLWI